MHWAWYYSTKDAILGAIWHRLVSHIGLSHLIELSQTSNQTNNHSSVDKDAFWATILPSLRPRAFFTTFRDFQDCCPIELRWDCDHSLQHSPVLGDRDHDTKDRTESEVVVSEDGAGHA